VLLIACNLRRCLLIKLVVLTGTLTCGWCGNQQHGGVRDGARCQTGIQGGTEQDVARMQSGDPHGTSRAAFLDPSEITDALGCYCGENAPLSCRLIDPGGPTRMKRGRYSWPTSRQRLRSQTSSRISSEWETSCRSSCHKMRTGGCLDM